MKVKNDIIIFQDYYYICIAWSHVIWFHSFPRTGVTSLEDQVSMTC